MFSATIPDVEAMLALLGLDEEAEGALPTIRFIDTERDLDQFAVITEVTIDTAEHSATTKFWG